MIDIGGLVGISPVVLTIGLIVFQMLSQSRDIKNKNVIVSRLKWLEKLQSAFSKYNGQIVAIEQAIVMEENIDVQEYANRLKTAETEILLKFKAHTYESIPEYKGQLADLFKENGVLKDEFRDINNADQCEKTMIRLMKTTTNYYISLAVAVQEQKQNEKSNSSFEDGNDLMDSPDLSREIFLSLLLQFQLCLGKIEWNRINRESNLLQIYKNRQMKKDNQCVALMRQNLTDIVESYYKQMNSEKTDNVDNIHNNPKSQGTQNNNRDNTKHETNQDEIPEFVKDHWDLNKTVGQNLEEILLEIDKKENGLSKLSLKTTSGKRYIYSSVAPIHPSGKSFVNPRKIDLPVTKKSIFLETNFSTYQGQRISERIIRLLNCIPDKN